MDQETMIHATHLVGPNLRLSPELQHRNDWGLSRFRRYLWREGRKKGRRNGLPVEQRAACRRQGPAPNTHQLDMGVGVGPAGLGQPFKSTRCLDLFMLFIFQLGIFTCFAFVLKSSHSSAHRAEESTLERAED